jgi:catechol 2,3-dioxygenase-like lactoylglutathione lyase family enzyme
MLSVETVHHVAITVTDIERSKQFYGGVLGLPEVRRPDFDFGGAWYEIGGREVHLIVHDATRTMRGTTAIDIKDGHFALRVRSYAEALTHLQAHGVSYLALPQNKTNWAQIYVTDPDGNVIELNADRSTIDSPRA